MINIDRKDYVSQSELAFISKRNRQWISNLTRLGLLSNTIRANGEKVRYYPLKASLRVLDKIPPRGRKNDKRRVKK